MSFVSDILTYDETRRIGDEYYTFYNPLYYGSLIVRVWQVQTPDRKQSGKNSNRFVSYGVSMYENGEFVDPLQDKRFTKFEWIKGRPWQDRIFTDREILVMLTDVATICKSNATIK
jgi:hypothetical protein